ncbi:MAG: hypothetical protein WCA38_21470 [Candidatus Acidiferrales bacterium]
MKTETRGFEMTSLRSKSVALILTMISSLAITSFTAAQKAKLVSVPAGTRILVRMVDSVDSSKQKTGFRFTATLEANLQAYDVTVAKKGATLYGVLAQASSSGRLKGSSQLTLELTDIVINGTAYPLLTSSYEVKGKGEGGSTAKKVIGGAGLGALIGGIAGGGKGAGIGAAVGAGAGTAVSAAKKGEQISIPSETLLEFRLQQPTSLPVAN